MYLLCELASKERLQVVGVDFEEAPHGRLLDLYVALLLRELRELLRVDRLALHKNKTLHVKFGLV